MYLSHLQFGILNSAGAAQRLRRDKANPVEPEFKRPGWKWGSSLPKSVNWFWPTVSWKRRLLARGHRPRATRNIERRLEIGLKP